MRYLSFLRNVHRLLAPERYLEIGIRSGTSLALARCRAVGIDPSFAIKAEINCDVALFRTTTDEYFARDQPLLPTGGKPFDLVFIDGLHLVEFALRDFIHAERYSSARSLIILDDVLPRTGDEAARVRHTAAWAGDVYRITAVLAKYRPELTVIPVATTPTGLLLVMGLDPQSTVLADNYDAILAEFRSVDPQRVPADLLDRWGVAEPRRVLEADFWPVLSMASIESSPEDVRPKLAERVSTSLGSAFVAFPAG